MPGRIPRAYHDCEKQHFQKRRGPTLIRFVVIAVVRPLHRLIGCADSHEGGQARSQSFADLGWQPEATPISQAPLARCRPTQFWLMLESSLSHAGAPRVTKADCCRARRGLADRQPCDRTVLGNRSFIRSSVQRVALSCWPLSLGKTSMLGTTAALREAKQGSEEGPPSSDARQLQCPSCAAVDALGSRSPRLSRSPHIIVQHGCLRSQPASGLVALPPRTGCSGRLSSTAKPRATTSASASGRRSAEPPEHAQPRAAHQPGVFDVDER